MVEELSLSGYQPFTEVVAQRAPHASSRDTYVISLPLHLISTYLPTPDPETPFPGNRRVNRRHAEKFGNYWRDNDNWVSPPLLVDTTIPLHEDFTPKFAAGGVEFGVLRLHQNSTSEFDILDGQHRILGWKIIGEQIATELKALRSNLQQAKQSGDDEQVRKWQSHIDENTAYQRRFESEFVTIEILQGISEEDHKQAFNDIAVNALGITKSITVSFDRRSMINRIAIDVAENNELVGDRVDWEKDRIVGRNENVISGRNLADIVRHIALGISGRMTTRREAEMNENSVATLVEKFFTSLIEGFPQLRAVQEDEVSALDLRSREMTLSSTVLRVLAGTFHNLAVDTTDERHPKIDPAGYKKATDLYKQISDHMAFPVEQGWIDTGYFEEDAKAPGSRSQDLKGLTSVLTTWGTTGKAFT